MRTGAAVFVLTLCAIFHSADVAAQTTTPAEAKPRPTAEQARAFVQSLLVKSPYRMSAQARAGEIRYRLRFESSREWAWPETGEQRATTDANGTELRICSDCGREQAPTDAMLRRYLASNAWVQSDDRRIRNFARQHTRGGPAHVRMQALVTAIQKHMTGAIDYRDYHDALTALETRGGDCTEYAVLLAASARALGIPARVVYGVAYSSRFTGQAHVFSPHVWVQAWDGKRWTSYDAGLGQFDAGHLALSVGDGALDGVPNVNRAIRDLRVLEAAGIVPAKAGDTAN